MKHKIGILQIHPHTMWKKGGGEIHAAKYIEHGQRDDMQIEYFNFQRANEYDLIHYFGSSYQMNEIGKFAQLNGVKVVGTPILFPSKKVFKYKFFLKVGKLLPFKTSLNFRQELLKDSDFLLANSKPEAEYFEQAYGIKAHNIKVLGTGVSKDYLEYNFSETHLPEEVKTLDKYILMVGRVTPLKNQMKVAKLLSTTEHKLVLVGQADHSHPAYINELQELVNNSKNIFWLKEVKGDSDTIKALYAGAEMHILWSRTEVAALVNMEAAALGTSLICRDLPSTKSIVAEHARFASSEAELVNRINELSSLDKNERAKEIQDAKEFIRSHHTWEHIVDESIKIYRGLLK